jgi:hypothetical protein
MKPPKESSVLIIGLARDVESKIKSEIVNLKTAFSEFLDVQFLILESDSEDCTIEVLENFSRTYSKFMFKSLGSLRFELPDRIDRISFCRAKAQELARGMILESDYVVLADLDGVNSLISKEAIGSCWSGPAWDVCTANQKYNYYDIYALRHPLLAPGDCWLEYLEYRKLGVHPMKALRKAVYNRQLHIPQDANWIEVDSAFGGLAIYEAQTFLSGIYSSRTESGEVVCEHVSFHESLKAKGKRIFINPRLINSEGVRKSRISYWLSFAFKYLISLCSSKLFDRKFIQ